MGDDNICVGKSFHVKACNIAIVLIVYLISEVYSGVFLSSVLQKRCCDVSGI